MPKGKKKKQIEETNQASETDSDLTQILDRELKITMINILWTLVEK